MKKEITVVIVGYNYGHLVAHAIDSVLSQTVLPKRILAVDDASDDGMCETASRYGVDVMKREKNMGTLDNFNDILMNHIFTEYVMYLGADNWLRPDALELMSNVDADIVSSDMYITGSDVASARAGMKTEKKHGYYIWRMRSLHGKINRSNFIHGSSLYNANIAKKFGYKAIRKTETGKRLHEDWGLWRQMILLGKATHEHIDEPLLYYRRHKFNFNGYY